MSKLSRLMSIVGVAWLLIAAPTMAVVTPLSGVVSVSVGDNFSCAVRGDGTVWCWGVNDAGQLGVATKPFDINDQKNTAVNALRVPTLSNARTVASGRQHSCALLADAAVWCWGSCDRGQLGVTGIAASQVPVKAAGLPAVKSLYAGAFSTCAISMSDEAWCWGDFDYYGGRGLLVSGKSGAQTAIPTRIVSLANVKAMALGDNVACALLMIGEVFCWGTRANLQIGDGGATTSDPATPQRVVGLSDAESVTVGGSFVCAARRTGAVVCWGYYPVVSNAGNHVGSDVSVAMNLSRSFKSLTAYFAACGLATDSSVQCWGRPEYELGAAPYSGEFVLRPGLMTPVIGGPATSVFTGRTHSCVLMVSKEVKCWSHSSFSDYDGLGVGWRVTTGEFPWYPVLVLEKGIWPSMGAFVVGVPGNRNPHFSPVISGLTVEDDIVLAASVEGIKPTGTVDFFDSAQQLVCSGAAIALPSQKYEYWGSWTGGYPSYAYCTLPKVNRAPGTYAFTARYNGDANHGVTVSDPASITLAAGAAKLRTMIEFRYAPLDYYFMTSRAADAAVLDPAPGWARTGSKFRVTASAPVDATKSGVLPISRFYFDKVARGQTRGSHFYTSSDADRKRLRDRNPQNLLAPGKPFDEGVDSWGFTTIDASTTNVEKCVYYGYLSVYRLFRTTPDDPNHRFTTDAAVVDAFIKSGWQYEGTAFCAVP